jgi:hypothetical membrane protein
MNSPRTLLLLGIAVPVLYFATLLIAAATWPSYSHVTRYASELGGPEAPFPAIFNVGIIAMGVTCILGSFGFGGALARLTEHRVSSVATAICLSLFGVSMIMGGAFPMPNPLHGGFGLAFALVPAPILMAVALRGSPSSGGMRLFLWVSFVLMAIVLAVMFGVGGLVTRANVGLWQRANALTMFPWIGIAAGWLRRSIAPERGGIAIAETATAS